MRFLPVFLSLATSLTVGVLARGGHAQGAPDGAPSADAAAAKRLFDGALEELAMNNAGAACPKLEKSQELDPKLRTESELAKCWAAIGRLGDALALFRRVEDEARLANDAAEEARAKSEADRLATRMPRLVVQVPSATGLTPGVEITRDGVALDRDAWGTPAFVDPGKHVVVMRAPGREPWERSVEVGEGRTATVEVVDLAAEGRAAVARKIAANRRAPSRGPDPIMLGLGITVGTLGVVGLATAAGLGASAAAKWNAAKEDCLEGTEPLVCNADGYAAGTAASSNATASTVLFVAGGIFAAGAIPLIVVSFSGKASSSDTQSITSFVTPGGAGLSWRGAF